MLVLARKIGQQVVLPGCGMTISILDVGKSQVRLGIAAPSDIQIFRKEVWDRICQQDKYTGANVARKVCALGLVDNQQSTAGLVDFPSNIGHGPASSILSEP